MTKPDTHLSVQSFVRRQILGVKGITNEQIAQNWEAVTKKKLDTKIIARHRTIFEKVLAYDQKNGLIEFASSQAELLLYQYKNIEQLLGPTDSDWAWSGEHCEVLLRNAIQQVLPPSLCVGKGYIYGQRPTEEGPKRSPEIDLLIYDTEQFPPVFSMGQFVIVRAESVRAAIQVKRTLDANTLKQGVENVVNAKQHVLDTSQFNGATNAEKMFSAVFSFEDRLHGDTQSDLSKSCESALKPHISEFRHGYLLPDYIGSLEGVFLRFCGVNINRMLYQGFRSVHKAKNVALPVLLFLLVNKIRPFGLKILPAFPSQLPLFGSLVVWEQSSQSGGAETQAQMSSGPE